MWGENTDAAEVMALPWNVAPGVGGANGWNRGPVPAQVGGPGAPMGRGVPGRGLEGGPPLWHPAQQAPLPPQWAHQPVHQSWQQPGSMNNMPQQPWQQTMEPKKLLSRGMPLVQPPQQQQPPQWGAHKVEQSTPWETPGQAKDWQTPAGAAPWAAPPQQQPQQQQQQQQQPQQPQQQAQPWQAPEWQNTPQHRPDPAVGQWQQQAPQPAPIMGMPPQPQQWGQPPPMGHVPHVPEPQRGMDMNPGQPGPWVAPQPSEVNNDMMWHDPNPKAKRMQRDTGTAVWGDPALQMTDIKRWKDVEDEMKPSGSDWNSPQPTGWGDPLPSDRWGQPGWEEPSHDSEGAQLGGVSGAPNAYRQMPDINSLTHQISEKLRNAVNKGFVRVELLSQQLSPEKISMLNQLLQKVPRLEQATQEIEHLRRNVHNTSSKTEYDRLVLEVEQLKLEMAMLQSKISESPQMGGPNPGTAGSRLNQWKKSNVEERSNLDNLVGALTLDDKLHGPTEWSTGGNDWGAENVLDVGKDDKDGPPGAPGDVDGPREFVPGKKWEWRDPNKVAEDPNATPGSQGQMFGGALPGNNAFGGWSSLIENTWSNASPR